MHTHTPQCLKSHYIGKIRQNTHPSEGLCGALPDCSHGVGVDDAYPHSPSHNSEVSIYYLRTKVFWPSVFV